MTKLKDIVARFSPNPDAHKAPEESIVRLHGDHLKNNTRRNYGTQRGGLVPCTSNKLHGHYPGGEWCPECLSYLEIVEERSRKDAEKRAAAARSFRAKIDAGTAPDYTVQDLRDAANAMRPVHALPKRSAGQKLYEQTVAQSVLTSYPWASKVPPSVQKTWQARALKMGLTDD